MSTDILFNMIPIDETENGKKYRIMISLPITIGFINDMYFVVEKGNERIIFKLKHKENKNGLVYFESDVFLATRAIYRYYFSYYVDGKHRFHKKKELINNNIIQDEMWKMSVNFDTPDWAKGKIMYHIFVDRFNRGSKEQMQEMPRRFIHDSWNEEIQIGPSEDGIWNNDFYGGDLQGIIKKLDYIKSIGVNILYLSPIVWSQSNHRYDTADYEIVDPYVGSNNDLKILCEQAHKREIKVILDAVFNHTGNDSKYFNEYNYFNEIGAYQSKDSPYTKFYKKRIIDGKDYYDYWWGMKNLPVCDGNSKEWQDYILGKNGVIDKWFKLGIDGLRLDVADELTDEFIEKVRMAVKRNKSDGFILGEVWKNPMRMQRGYIESGMGMDSVMNYQLVDALIRYFKYGDIHKLSYIINDIKNEYPEETIQTLMNFTSTHDISRPIDIFGLTNEFNEFSEWAWNPNNSDPNYCKNRKLTNEEYNRGKELYMAYVTALLFMPGILSIFYGDEVGITGLGNLANRKPYPYGKEDTNLLDFFKSISNIRFNNKFLERADLNMLKINHDYLMFERVLADDKALITVNRTDEDKDFSVPDEYKESEVVYTLKKSKFGHLSPYGAIALKKTNK